MLSSSAKAFVIKIFNIENYYDTKNRKGKYHKKKISSSEKMFRINHKNSEQFPKKIIFRFEKSHFNSKLGKEILS